jgi:hypothetical protein
MNTPQIIIIILLIILLVLSALLIAINSKLYTINSIKRGGDVSIKLINKFLNNNDLDINDAYMFQQHLSQIYEINDDLKFNTMDDEQLMDIYLTWKESAQVDIQPPQDAMYMEASQDAMYMEAPQRTDPIMRFLLSKNESKNYQNFQLYLIGRYIEKVDDFTNYSEDIKNALYQQWKKEVIHLPIPSPRPSQDAMYMEAPLKGEAINNNGVSIKEINKFFNAAKINDNAKAFQGYMNNLGYPTTDADFIDLGYIQQGELYNAYNKQPQIEAAEPVIRAAEPVIRAVEPVIRAAEPVIRAEKPLDVYKIAEFLKGKRIDIINTMHNGGKRNKFVLEFKKYLENNRITSDSFDTDIANGNIQQLYDKWNIPNI